MPKPTPTPPPHWSLLALAAAYERREVAECEASRLRQVVARLRAINPVSVKNVERSI